MDPVITRLTARQMGLITRRQALELGVNKYSLEHLVRSKQLVRVTPRVLQVAGTPSSDHMKVMCAVLDAGAFASHDTAAAIWGVPHFELTPVHVTRQRGGRVRPSHVAIVHETRWLPDDHTTSFAGLPVLRPFRLLFDIAATHDRRRTESALDWLWSNRQVTIAALDLILAQLSAPGRPGTRMLRQLVEERRDQGPYGSGLERRFHYLVRAAGLPPFRRQVNVGDGEDWIGRVDFMSTTHMLIVEVDSERHHAALSDRRRDEARRARLERAGFTLRVIDEADLFGPRDVMIAKLRQWFREARRR